jgi:UDP-N-acetylglucosamine--N-acetylmuramyl-(pentapeptide) pyrophosphoryl-undecaprenol N-acetylglucosamine transferase
MKVIMVGGGSGGHVYPAIAVAQALQDRILDSQVLFIGSEGGIEEKIVPEARFSLSTIKARGMLRKISFKAITSPFYAVAGFFDSLKILKTFKPDVIVATGGFVSLPVVLAGFFLRIPVILHEGNLIPGLSARICKWFASRVNVAFESQRKYFKWKKTYCAGGPVRKEIIKTIKGIAIQNMGLRQDQKIILVLGGSQGARSINKVTVDALPDLANLNVQIIHVCGERDYGWIKDSVREGYPFYHLISYMYNIWDGLAACDLVVSRAGATAISEIVARRLPSILVPFPYSAEGHQDRNASVLEKAGASVVIKDNDLNKEVLLREIDRILKDRELCAKMSDASATLGKPDAAHEFVNIITDLLGIDLYAKKRKKRARQQA